MTPEWSHQMGAAARAYYAECYQQGIVVTKLADLARGPRRLGIPRSLFNPRSSTIRSRLPYRSSPVRGPDIESVELEQATQDAALGVSYLISTQERALQSWVQDGRHTYEVQIF